MFTAPPPKFLNKRSIFFKTIAISLFTSIPVLTVAQPSFSDIELPSSPNFQNKNPDGYSHENIPTQAFPNGTVERSSFNAGEYSYGDNTFILFESQSTDPDQVIDNKSGELSFDFENSALRIVHKEGDGGYNSLFARISGKTSFTGKNLELYFEGWQDMIRVNSGGNLSIDVENAWFEFNAIDSTGTDQDFGLLRQQGAKTKTQIAVKNQLVFKVTTPVNQRNDTNGILYLIGGESNIDANDIFIIAETQNPEDHFLNGVYLNSTLLNLGQNSSLNQLVITGVASAFMFENSGVLNLDTNSLYVDTIFASGEMGYFLNNSHEYSDANVNISVANNAEVKGNIFLVEGEYNLDFGQNSIIQTQLIRNEYGKIILSLDKNSLLTGRIWDYSAEYGDSFTNITLDGSTWDVSGSSDFYKLVANDSDIVFHDLGTPDKPTLKLGNLTGNGSTFLLQNDRNSSSFIQLGKESTKGVHKVQLTNSINSEDEINIHFANDLSGNIVFEGSTSLTDAGLFVVTPELSSLSSANGNDWFITNIKEDPAPTPTAMLDGFQNNYLFWRTLTDSTKERFGQLRHGQSAGVWGRVTAGSLSQGDLTNDYQTYRLGADTSIQPGLSLGAMFEIHEGDLDTSNGKGDMQAITAAIYGLYVSPSGYYADAGFRFGVMDYEYKNTALLYDEYDYNSSAVGAWLEVGKEWAFANNYTLTPHLAINFGRFGTEHFTSDNGLKAKVDSVNSVIFTVGTDVGYKTETFEVSAVADLMTEVAGSQDIRISHNEASLTRSADYSDTWMEFGLSASYRPTDDTLLWVNGRRSAFADLDNDWRINAGVRWSFY